MSISIPAAQGRAPSLYDEQLQRQQQEKRLFAGFPSASAGDRLVLRPEPPLHADGEAGGES